MKIAIIGAGAAGCFAAARLGEKIRRSGNPEAAEIHVYESGTRPLAKVRITGGGRCNLTNSFRTVKSAEAVYPRGARLMKRLLKQFSHADTMAWFEGAGVPLVVQADECVFPASQTSEDIITALLRSMQAAGVRLHTGYRAKRIEQMADGGYRIAFTNDQTAKADVVIVTTGGSPRQSGLDFLEPLNLETLPPVPSLFSLTLEGHPLGALSGHVVQDVAVRIPGTKLAAQGTLLITHQGLSGPAILRLSSYAARFLHTAGYRAPLAINWWGPHNETEILACLRQLTAAQYNKQLTNIVPSHLTARLWATLLERCGVQADTRAKDLHAKTLQRLAAQLSNHTFTIAGRNPHKEEFVTCGGIALAEVNPNTLECKKHPRLYFAGEVLDVDAVTGGFNLQAAWSMADAVARAVAQGWS